MSESIKRLIYEEEGQDLVEYTLLLVFLALAALVALPALGHAVSNVLVRAKSTLESGS